MNLTKLLHTGSEKADQYLLRMYNQSKDITGAFCAKAPAADGAKEGLAARAARAVKGVGLEVACRAERAAVFVLLSVAVLPQLLFLPIAFAASASRLIRSSFISHCALAYFSLVHKELCILGELLPAMLTPTFKPTFISTNAFNLAKKVNCEEQYQIYSSIAWRSSYASYKQAKLLQIGFGVPEDKYKAKEIFKKLASQGIAKAHYRLGMIYQYDGVFKQNPEKSYDHLKAASDLHLAKATRKLAEYFAKKYFPVSGDHKADNFYQKAAEQGDHYSQYKLAAAKAIDHDKKTSLQGIKQLEAMLDWDSEIALDAADKLIGLYTSNTCALVADGSKAELENKAVELARKLLQKRFSIAKPRFLNHFIQNGAKHLVDIYEKRLDLLKKDPAAHKQEWPQMITDLKEAAVITNHASYLLGRIYAEGIMVEKDPKQAAEHFKIAARADGLSYNNPRGFAAYQLLKEIEHPIANKIPLVSRFI